MTMAMARAMALTGQHPGKNAPDGEVWGKIVVEAEGEEGRSGPAMGC